jgi:hypothetical protein
MNNTLFLDVTKYSLVEVYKCSEMYCLHLQGQRAGSLLLGCLAVSQKHGKTSIWLHTITSENIIFFIVTTVRTSNPTAL